MHCEEQSENQQTVLCLKTLTMPFFWQLLYFISYTWILVYFNDKNVIFGA